MREFRAQPLLSDSARNLKIKRINVSAIIREFRAQPLLSDSARNLKIKGINVSAIIYV